jgi:hypothetical protein
VTEWRDDASGARGPDANAHVYAEGAAFYVVLIKAGYYDEAAEFAEWFLDTFDLDLET